MDGVIKVNAAVYELVCVNMLVICVCGIMQPHVDFNVAYLCTHTSTNIVDIFAEVCVHISTDFYRILFIFIFNFHFTFSNFCVEHTVSLAHLLLFYAISQIYLIRYQRTINSNLLWLLSFYISETDLLHSSYLLLNSLFYYYNLVSFLSLFS